VREAGGLIKDLSGGDDWLENGRVVATAPKIMHSMLTVMSDYYAN